MTRFDTDLTPKRPKSAMSVVEMDLDQETLFNKMSSFAQDEIVAVIEMIKNAPPHMVEFVPGKHRHILACFSSACNAVQVWNIGGMSSMEPLTKVGYPKKRSKYDQGEHNFGGRAGFVCSTTEDGSSEIASCFKGRFHGLKFTPRKILATVPFEEADDNVVKRAEEYLARIGLTLDNTPNGFKKALKEYGFTVVSLNKTRTRADSDIPAAKRQIERYPDVLPSQLQARVAIDTCKVTVILDGKGTRIKPIQLKPLPGFQTLKQSLPDTCIDPVSGKEVLIRTTDAEYQIIVETSQEKLTTANLRELNTVSFFNGSKYIASIPMKEFVATPTSLYLSATVTVPDLKGDRIKGGDWKEVTDDSYFRALKEWLKEPLNRVDAKVASYFKRTESQSYTEDIVKQFKEVERIFNKVLRMDDAVGPGDEPDWKRKLPVTRIDVEDGCSTIVLASNTVTTPRIQCFGKGVNKDEVIVPYIPANFRLQRKGLDIDFENGKLISGSPGYGEVKFMDMDSGICSDPFFIRIVDVKNVEFAPPIPLKIRERFDLDITFHDIDGNQYKTQNIFRVLVEGYPEDKDLASIRSNGIITALATSDTSVSIRYGKDKVVSIPFSITTEEIPRKKRSGNKTGSHKILLCGMIDEDMRGSVKTVIGHSIDRSVITGQPGCESTLWINSVSTESHYLTNGISNVFLSDAWYIHITEQLYNALLSLYANKVYDKKHFMVEYTPSLVKDLQEEASKQCRKALPLLRNQLQVITRLD